MNSLVLQTATRYLLPLLVLYAIFLLAEGHHKPGGGFSGGLVAAGAIALCALSYGVDAARRLLRLEPPQWIGAGLLLLLAAGVSGWFRSKPFLTGLWSDVPTLGGGSIVLGTPLLFDIGIFLVVFGATLMILFIFAEDRK